MKYLSIHCLNLNLRNKGAWFDSQMTFECVAFTISSTNKQQPFIYINGKHLEYKMSCNLSQIVL